MNALTINGGQSVNVWEKQDRIKALVAPNLSSDEFGLFMEIGSHLGANPFLREIWAVKYGSSPAAIFLGRDFYRKKAQEQETYDGHTVDAVYSKDQFSVNNGIPSHSYTPGDRGNLIGAYCTVHLKNTKVPFYVFVELSEYNLGKSNWSKMPATMIKKVAEAQALRGAFQGIFAGTYGEAEQWTEVEVQTEPQDLDAAIIEVSEATEPNQVTEIANKYPHLKTNKAFRAAAKAALKTIANNNNNE